MKKLISAILSVSMLLSGAVVYAADPVTVIDEQFDYSDIDEMKAAGWEVTIPTDANLTEAYAVATDGKFTTKMQKSVKDRSAHTIIAEKALSEQENGGLILNAGIGLDETGSEYTNSSAGISFIDEEGNIKGTIEIHSYNALAETQPAFVLTVGGKSESITCKEYSDMGGTVTDRESFYKGTIYDGTIYNIKLVSDEKQNAIRLYAEDIEEPILGIDGVCISGAVKIRLSHMQQSTNKIRLTNSAGLFDFVTLTYGDVGAITPPSGDGGDDEDDSGDDSGNGDNTEGDDNTGGSGDNTGGDDSTSGNDSDNDPAKEEAEGIQNQVNILYENFKTTEAWDITLPNQSGLNECYTETNEGVVKTKMKKSLTGRERHTISLSRKLDKEACTEMVVRAGMGLDETGSEYTNSQISIVLKDTQNAEIVRLKLASGYGGTMEGRKVWSVKTNKTEAGVYGSDFPVKYNGELYDIKLHLKPNEGVLDFYAEDMEEPLLVGVEYDAEGVYISDIVLEHLQISYTKKKVSNSAGYFDYVKTDANILVTEEDKKRVADAAEHLETRHLTQEKPDSVTKGLTLPDYSDNGCAIVWTSSDETVITSNGIVLRDEYENKTVTLTAHFISGYADFYKDYTFTVLAIGKLIWKEYFTDDYQGAAPKGERTVKYPTISSVDTDCVIVPDPDDSSNKVIRHSNHMDGVQDYAGFTVTYDMGFMLEGRARISFRARLEQTGISTNISIYNNDGQSFVTLGGTSEWTINGVATGVAVTPGKWMSFVIDLNTNEGYLQLYVDGKACATANVAANYDKNYKIAKYNIYSWNKTTGVNAQLYFDDLRIEENLNVHVDNVRSALNPEELSGEIAGGFALPVQIDGVDILWSSSDTSALSFDEQGNATVVRGAKEKTVTITAKLNYKGYEAEKTFNSTVIHQLTDADNVQKDIEILKDTEFSDEDKERITKSFDLPTSGRYSSTIIWTSDNKAIKVENGRAVVTAPLEDTKVTLTATVKCGKEEKTEEFTFTVYAALPYNILKDASVLKTTSELASNPAGGLIDDNFSTSYMTVPLAKTHETLIELNSEKSIGAFLFMCEDNVKSIEILTSADDDFYKSVYKSDNVKNERTKISVQPSKVNYIKFIVTPKDSKKSAVISELMAFETLLSDSECVKADLEKLNIPENVSSDITLVTNGENGSVITWASSDENVIEKNGNVIRGSKDETVTLTATATKNDAKEEKKFEVTVKAKVSSGGSGGGSSGGGISSGSGNSSIVLSGITSTTESNESGEASAFSDVNDKMWSYKYINMLREKGIVSGDGGMFCPKNNITREEFATMLYKCSPTEPELKEIAFSDMDETHWAYEFVKKLFSGGIISGMSENEFGTGVNITRQDASVMICRVLEKTHTDLKEYELKFADADSVSDYAKEYVAKLTGTGIINGRDDNTFAPKDLLTREEAAKMMCVLVSLIG